MENNNELSWWQRSVVKIMKMGRVPQHVGFIMDGNRRYARKSNIATIKGHEKGDWQYFAIRNFRQF